MVVSEIKDPASGDEKDEEQDDQDKINESDVSSIGRYYAHMWHVRVDIGDILCHKPCHVLGWLICVRWLYHVGTPEIKITT